MHTIHLTPELLEWLKIFLERTDLKGREVPAFMEIAKAVAAAQKQQ